jgi:hypothetical protein
LQAISLDPNPSPASNLPPKFKSTKPNPNPSPTAPPCGRLLAGDQTSTKPFACNQPPTKIQKHQTKNQTHHPQHHLVGGCLQAIRPRPNPSPASNLPQKFKSTKPKTKPITHSTTLWEAACRRSDLAPNPSLASKLPPKFKSTKPKTKPVTHSTTLWEAACRRSDLDRNPSPASLLPQKIKNTEPTPARTAQTTFCSKTSQSQLGDTFWR